jgi:hypothetical protein
VALGGTSFAAVRLTGKDIRDSSLTGRDVRNRTLTGADIRDHSLLLRDLRLGQLPAGPKGDPGATGATGATGAAGPPGPPGAIAGYAERMLPGAHINASTIGNGDLLVDSDAPFAPYVVQGSVVLVNQGAETSTVDCYISQAFSGGAGSPRSGRWDETFVTLDPGQRETVPLAAASSLLGPVLMCEGQEDPGPDVGLDNIQPETAKLTAIQVSELP